MGRVAWVLGEEALVCIYLSILKTIFQQTTFLDINKQREGDTVLWAGLPRLQRGLSWYGGGGVTGPHTCRFVEALPGWTDFGIWHFKFFIRCVNRQMEKYTGGKSAKDAGGSQLMWTREGELVRHTHVSLQLQCSSLSICETKLLQDLHFPYYQAVGFF